MATNNPLPGGEAVIPDKGKTDDELHAGMTKAERDALGDGDTFDDQTGEVAHEDNEPKENEEDQGEEVTAEEKAAAAALLAASGKPADKESDAAAGRDDGGAVEDGPTVAPEILKPTAPADAGEQVKAIDTQREELAQKFDDGEITSKEFRQQDRALEEQRGKLTWAMERDRLAADLNAQQREASWFGAVADFVKEFPEVKGNATLWAAFDQHVRQVTGNEANTSKLSDAKMLKLAYESWCKDLGRTPKGATPPKNPDPNPDPKLGSKRVLPPNLGKQPAASAEDPSGGEFANLDRLAETDGPAFETAMAQLKPADRERYLAT